MSDFAWYVAAAVVAVVFMASTALLMAVWYALDPLMKD